LQELDLSAHLRRRGDRRAGTAEQGGGRRWRLYSDEPAVRPGQQASGKLWWCKWKVGAAPVGGDDGRRVKLAVGTNGGGNGGATALHRVRKDGDDPFIDGREL
jgi:hypothetical protein